MEQFSLKCSIVHRFFFFRTVCMFGSSASVKAVWRMDVLLVIIHERRPVAIRFLPDGAKSRVLQADSRKEEGR